MGIVIVDYNTGNLNSIKNMLRRLGHSSVISSDIDVIRAAEKLILPGVGSFDTGMKGLLDLGLVEVLNYKVLEEYTPILGICLGMQLMCESSSEGRLNGLGWFDAQVNKFPQKTTAGKKLKVPHMGWNEIATYKESFLSSEFSDSPRFYFVHSYFVKANVESDILFHSDYDFRFVSGMERNNIVCVQFHPEKSHKYGMQLLANFIKNY